MFYLKKDDDTYEFIIDKEIPLVMTGNRRKDMEENTRLFHAVIEKHIKNIQPSGCGYIIAGKQHRR
jgi:hypothetical protein